MNTNVTYFQAYNPFLRQMKRNLPTEMWSMQWWNREEKSIVASVYEYG